MDSDLDLNIALEKLHRLQLEDGDLGAAYWYQISKLLGASRDKANFRI